MGRSWVIVLSGCLCLAGCTCSETGLVGGDVASHDDGPLDVLEEIIDTREEASVVDIVEEDPVFDVEEEPDPCTYTYIDDEYVNTSFQQCGPGLPPYCSSFADDSCPARAPCRGDPCVEGVAPYCVYCLGGLSRVWSVGVTCHEGVWVADIQFCDSATACFTDGICEDYDPCTVEACYFGVCVWIDVC